MIETELFANQWELYADLEARNTLGLSLTLPAYDQNRVPFLVSLAERGGDDVNLTFIGADEDGWPYGRVNCDDCGSEVWDWTPAYPVTVIYPEES